MHHHRVALANAVEHAKRLAAGQHVVFADDFEPVDRRMTAQNFVVMLRPQAEAKAEERRLGRIQLAIRTRCRGWFLQFAGDVHMASTVAGRQWTLAQSYL